MPRLPGRFLLRELTWTEFKLTDQGTLLGFLWTLLYPALMFGVLYTLFIRWMGKFVDQYAAYLLIGLVFWNFFQRATSQGLGSLIRRSALIQNYKVPMEALVLSSVGAVFLSFLLELAVLSGFLLLLGCRPHWVWLFLPVQACAMLLMATGASFFLARVAVDYQDMQRIWDVLCTALFYLTPVFYPLSIITEWKRGWLLINPVTQVLIGTRRCLMEGAAPDLRALAAVLLGATAVVVLGAALLRRAERRIADELMKF